jgi:hypothetical protein
MISHQHRCIFVQLRRTAGNSIELALGGIVLPDKNRKKVLEWDNKLHRGSSDYKIDARGHPIGFVCMTYTWYLLFDIM